MARLLATRLETWSQCDHGRHRRFYHNNRIVKYDEELYKFFLHAKHVGGMLNMSGYCAVQGLCWHRKGVVYSGIKFVLAASSVVWFDHASIVLHSIYSFNVWDYQSDSIGTKYFKLYRGGLRVFRFYFYDHQYTENYPVLGSKVADSRFELAFHKAVCDVRKDDMEVIQDVLYHTGVLVTLYFVQLARYVRDDPEWDNEVTVTIVYVY